MVLRLRDGLQRAKVVTLSANGIKKPPELCS
jgi:hypothetical protein